MGTPKARGYGRFPLVVHIPARPDRDGPIAGDDFMATGCLVARSAKWTRDTSARSSIGCAWCRNRLDRSHGSGRLYVAGQVMSNFNNFVQITDRFQQAHVNFAVLARFVKDGSLGKSQSCG